MLGGTRLHGQRNILCRVVLVYQIAVIQLKRLLCTAALVTNDKNRLVKQQFFTVDSLDGCCVMGSRVASVDTRGRYMRLLISCLCWQVGTASLN